ncbi:MAG: chorismate mutase [Clostridiales bacterium]|nr:chorismate mutase [Clostridiales bacterium]
MNLQDYRKTIDALDLQIVTAFTERMAVAEKIAQYKKKQGLAITDTKREEEKLESLTALMPEGLAKEIRLLYHTIFDLSKERQRKIFSD